MSDYFAKEKDFGNAFYYAVLSYWNAVVRTAFSGKRKHLEYLLSDKYEYPSIAKLAPKTHNLDTKNAFEKILKVISRFSEELRIISELCYSVGGSNKFLEPPYYDNEPYYLRLYRLLNENKEYVKCLKVVRDINFELQYKKYILI